MGQKINPFIFRVIKNRNWNCSWFTKKNNFSNYLIEDLRIRTFLDNYLKNIPIGKIIIQKSLISIYIILYVKKKVALIHDHNIDIMILKNNITKYIGRTTFLSIRNIVNPDIDVSLIFYKLKKKIQDRKPYKNIIKNIIDSAFKSNAWGIKITIKGRINGSIMSKKQVFKQGKIPLHKISSNIKYFNGVVITNYGSIGIKIWLCLGNLIYD